MKFRCPIRRSELRMRTRRVLREVRKPVERVRCAAEAVARGTGLRALEWFHEGMKIFRRSDAQYNRDMSGDGGSMTLPAGEPAAGPWTAVSEKALARIVFDAARNSLEGPRIVAVDGRGASGKTTLAERLARQVSHSAIVHTDDVAWNEPFFAWGDLLRDHILNPLRHGKGVLFSPPAWTQHSRDGAIEIAAGLDLVIVEGVGASQRELNDLIDATVWVQSDFAAAETRGIARDLAQGANGDADETIAFWHEWMNEELQFLADQRPWERACVIVAGTPTIPLDADQLAISRALL